MQVRHWCSKVEAARSDFPASQSPPMLNSYFAFSLTNKHIGYAYCSPPYPIHYQSCQTSFLSTANHHESSYGCVLKLRPFVQSAPGRSFSFLILQGGREGLCGGCKGERGEAVPSTAFIIIIIFKSGIREPLRVTLHSGGEDGLMKTAYNIQGCLQVGNSWLKKWGYQWETEKQAGRQAGFHFQQSCLLFKELS